MPKVTTIKDAKERSLKKWYNIGIMINNINEVAGRPCGFCFYSRHIKNHDIKIISCSLCLVENTCTELVGKEFMSKIRELLGTVERITDYIHNIKEDE